MFDPKALSAMSDEGPPAHLRQLSTNITAKLALIIVSELPAMPHTLQLELEAAMDTRTVHDWTRVANALRHAYGRPGLAQEVEDALDIN